MEDAPGGPLAVIVGIIDESDRAWADAYEQILSTLTFGDEAPADGNG